jgi:D-alanyl-D-alanine carboxypeptidase/D-alanyl-D-alanine-endopeptidase (penicillin-binding protein 4)
MSSSSRRAAWAAIAVAAAAAACVVRDPPRTTPVLPPARQLAADLSRILDDPALAHGTWGVAVRSLATGETLFEHNPGKLLMPASNMKIVTLAAAADRLGWDYTYETRLLAAGRVTGGILDGDLVVVGSGDPSLTTADGSADRLFDDWAGRLAQLGVRTVAGRIVGDDDAFEDLELGFGWSWDDLADDYAAGVGALQINESAVALTVSPGPHAGDSAAVAAVPAGVGVAVVNRASTVEAGGPTALSARRLPGRRQLELSGTIAAGSPPAALSVSVDNPTAFYVEMLRTALIARGIDVRGPAVDIDDLAIKPARNAAPVAAHRSPPLSAMAVRLMKDSQNQYAETFLKTLGAGGNAPASAAAGRDAVQKILGAWGVPASALIQRDGSGLSRYDYVTADAVAAILAHMWGDARLKDAFVASLPVAGRDGTIAGRLKGTAAENNARAKSGSMSNVRALGGYVTGSGGEPIAFAIIANNFETPAAVVNQATDAIVARLARFAR